MIGDQDVGSTLCRTDAFKQTRDCWDIERFRQVVLDARDGKGFRGVSRENLSHVQEPEKSPKRDRFEFR
jgi:hypothetical protein